MNQKKGNEEMRKNKEKFLTLISCPMKWRIALMV
jgi:hypothetical protein